MEIESHLFIFRYLNGKLSFFGGAFHSVINKASVSADGNNSPGAKGFAAVFAQAAVYIDAAAF